MRMFARNMDVLAGIEQGGSQWLRPLEGGSELASTKYAKGSRRNISAHYDLSNEVWLMLDPTMTYSSRLFRNCRKFIAGGIHREIRSNLSQTSTSATIMLWKSALVGEDLQNTPLRNSVAESLRL